MALNEFESFRILRTVVNKPTRNALNDTDPISAAINATTGTIANNWLSKQYSLVPDNELGAEYFNPDGTRKDFNDLTPIEKGAIGMDFVRGQMRNVNRTAEVPAQVDSTRDSAKTTADTETAADWGTRESDGGAGGAGLRRSP